MQKLTASQGGLGEEDLRGGGGEGEEDWMGGWENWVDDGRIR